ncbi:peptidase S8/S53 subtilisin kexin sedolisin [Deinococcus aerius]|uniref:Peptidase S8/S53 subtilisin kexin sedolisin n=1 Tax=Deinococcus aerius TaxID=200253 RepID=A0A2I9DS51_9DEIO|nr:S8 family peptidase [Deinococcus aerius]GBF05257.1 peptidase S8/S53 subtilisin kexin sedolisin [Deinococcus aerius]
MNSRIAPLTLGLTLLFAACGQQMASGPADNTQAATPERGTRTSAPLLGTSNPDAIPGQYIVVLSEGAMPSNLGAQDTGGLVRSLGLDPQGITVQHLYTQALSGFAAKLSAQNLATLRADKRVKYIEQDGVVRASATQSGATWGIDRIDQRNLPLDGNYTYTTTASNVTAYIIDTGINTSHTDFGGRAVWGTNQTGDGNNSDCQGHGTHVAGTVGGSTWGVAKGVKLVAVKVLDCSGSGTNSGVIAGINWAVSNKTGPAVANMSLGGGASQAVDDAVNNAASKNLVMAVAAGNENQNACNVSPARAANAITVGATTRTDSRDTGYSNYGSCLDIFAPGTGITSAWIGSTTATNTISGTSMATPHVAGAAALILANNPSYTTAQVTSALVNGATTGKVTNAGTGSPNRLLYTGTGGTTTPPSGTTTTYTGSVSQGSSSWKPSTSGFSYAGGTLRGSLSGPSGTDFDLYLQKWNGSAWADVAASEGGTSSESINYAAGSGSYRWEVYAYSGSGSYTLTETK